MKEVLQNIQNKLTSEVSELKYVDEDWGQLNMYQPPVKWPCCLIDITSIDYTNLGVDRGGFPQNRQTGKVVVKLTLANLKLTNSSGFAPQAQKDKAWYIWDLAKLIHEKLHGFCPSDNAGRMMRNNLQASVRDDGIQEYFITYSFEISNV